MKTDKTKTFILILMHTSHNTQELKYERSLLILGQDKTITVQFFGIYIYNKIYAFHKSTDGHTNAISGDKHNGVRLKIKIFTIFFCDLLLR